MQREAAELAEHGHVKEAKNLVRKAAAMLEKAELLDHHRPERAEERMREMKERLKMLWMESRELEEVGGKGERLADVRREAKAIERELGEFARQERRGQDDSPDDIARRLEHMAVAVEHLHQAGLHDIAEHVAERAEDTERQLHERGRHGERDAMHKVLKQLEEVRQEVERLRDEVNSLKSER